MTEEDFLKSKGEITKSNLDFWDKECQICDISTECFSCSKTTGLSYESKKGVEVANNVRRKLRDGHIFVTVDHLVLTRPEDIILELMKNPVTVYEPRINRFSM